MNKGLFGSDGKPANIPLKRVNITGEITGLHAELSVEQLYLNEQNQDLEIIYTFPIPDQAVVSMFSAQIGDRTITGEIRGKEEAFRIYDQALSSGDSAFLLEQFRPNVFQVSLGRILPGEDVKIKVVYLDSVSYQDGELRISIPTLVAPRYIPGDRKSDKMGMGLAHPTSEVPDADFITPPVGRGAEYRVELDLTLRPLMPVDQFSSPSHPISIKNMDDASMRVTLAEEGGALLDRDIIILGRCRDDSYSAGVSWQDPASGEGYLYLTIFPDFGLRGGSEARNYIFLIDISGSMDGSKLLQAKNALQLCLRNMEDGDTFNIVAFESESYFFSPRGNVPFNQASLDRAGVWINELSAMGGTEIMKPVEYALQNSGEKDTVILLFTDGQVGNEKEIINQVRRNIGGNRLFTFGIDTAVNSYFMNQLAEAGGGLAEFVYPGERIEDKVIRQFFRINSPLIRDVTVTWRGVQQMDVYPADIAVLFDQEPLALVGKYSGKLGGSVTVCGKFNNEELRVEMDLMHLALQKESGFLRKLWGKKKIEQLEKELEGINPRRKQTLIEELVKVSRDYDIGSAHTSFVAVEERVDKATGLPETVVVPVAPAAEWRMFTSARLAERDISFYSSYDPPCFSRSSASQMNVESSMNLRLPYADLDVSEMMFKAGDASSGSLSGEALLQEAVRCIALQQRADGSFPAEKGTAAAEVSNYQNTALATLAILLAAENLSIYRRQIEKSVHYLLNMQTDKLISKLQFYLAGLTYKMYLEKSNPGKKIAEQVGLEIERICEKERSLSDALLKPGIAQRAVIEETLDLLGDGKHSLEELTEKAGSDKGTAFLAAACIKQALLDAPGRR